MTNIVSKDANKKDTGGSAYPYNSAIPNIHGSYDYTNIPGMTLRDYFATNAMQVTATALGYKNPDVAKEAYAIADKMIAERNK